MLGKSLGLTEDLAGMAVRNWLSVESGGMQQQFKALHGVVRPQDRQFFEIQEKRQIHATMLCCRSAKTLSQHIDFCLAGAGYKYPGLSLVEQLCT
jgi:hypothetical protein